MAEREREGSRMAPMCLCTLWDEVEKSSWLGHAKANAQNVPRWHPTQEVTWHIIKNLLMCLIPIVDQHVEQAFHTLRKSQKFYCEISLSVSRKWSMAHMVSSPLQLRRAAATGDQCSEAWDRQRQRRSGKANFNDWMLSWHSWYEK